MKLFAWKAILGYKCIAKGFIIAKNIEEAKCKLNYIVYENKDVEVQLNYDYPDEGYEIDKNGIVKTYYD